MLNSVWFDRSVVLIRVLLAGQYLASGVNWFFKFLPMPAASDPVLASYKAPLMGAIIQSGWMMPMVKGLEVLTGLSLLFNLFVPLMLVVSFPVALMTFLLDAFILSYVWGWIIGTVPSGVAIPEILDMLYFGGAVLSMQAYLMFAYLPTHYRPMFALKGVAKHP